MVEIGEAVEGHRLDNRRMLHILGNEFVEDIALGVPDFAILEVVSLGIRLAERDGGNSVEGEVCVVAAAGTGRTGLGTALALVDGEGELGIEVLQSDT